MQQQHSVKHKRNHLINAVVNAAVILACSALSSQAQATLANNAILKFTAGTWGCAISGTYPNCLYGISNVTSGSYFSMDKTHIGTIDPGEKTAIVPNAGIIIGSIQPASGSHSGDPDNTESPGIDKPWKFFSNTGLHQTTKAIAIKSDDGAGKVKLDFSGWNVTWNKISSINMGAGLDNGIATLTCGTACANGDSFTLDYAATVPLGDPSGFGGVGYTVHMVGTVSVPGALTASTGTLGVGPFAVKAGSTDGRISMADLTSTANGNAIAADTGFTYGGGLYDFTITSVVGTTAQIMIPLAAPIPANAIYREYINSAWTTFTADSTNLLASAAKVAGACPAVGNSAYDPTKGLVKGNDCLQLTIADNGPYDSNATTGTIADPGGIATAVVKQVDTRTWGTSGCSMSQSPVDPTQRADWWLVAGFFVALGWLRRKRHAE